MGCVGPSRVPLWEAHPIRDYRINYVENLKLTQLRKLFRIFQSSPIQSLNIFGVREDQVLYFTNLSKFELIENHWFNGLGPAHELQGMHALDHSPLLPPDRLDVGRRC
jgi:hypothetical protein